MSNFQAYTVKNRGEIVGLGKEGSDFIVETFSSWMCKRRKRARKATKTNDDEEEGEEEEAAADPLDGVTQDNPERKKLLNLLAMMAEDEELPMEYNIMKIGLLANHLVCTTIYIINFCLANL